MTRLSRILLTALLLASAGVLTSALPVAAEVSASPTEEDKRKAGALYQEGQRLFDQELYSSAMGAFQKAQALFPAPANLYNIAKCNERLGSAEGCVESYKAYLVSYLESRGRNPPDLADIENSIAKCQIGMRVLVDLRSAPPGASVAIDDPSKLVGQTPLQVPITPGTHTLYLTLAGHLPMERKIEVLSGRPLQLDLEMAPELSLVVATEPPGAMVTIAGVAHGQTPLKLVREPGNYHVLVSMAGYTPVETRVQLLPGEPVQLFFKLEAERHMGRVKVSANVRRAAIFIDGKNFGLTPYEQEIEVSAGGHQVTLTRDRYTPVSATITVGDGQEVTFHGDLWLRDPPTTWKGYLGWTSIGLGAVATIGGYLLSAYGPPPPTPAILYEGTPEYETWAKRQAALYAVGGGLGGMGILLAILDAMDNQMVDPEDAADASSLRWSPALGRDGLGAGLQGSF